MCVCYNLIARIQDSILLSKLKGLMVCLGLPIEWPIFGMSSVEWLLDGTLSM